MLSVTIAAEIRDSICIIKPQTSEIGQKLYLDIADSFQRAGYDDLASEFKREGEGEPYGSGFLVKATDGSLWVVTNRHVVQNATQAKLVFENGSGISTTLEFCPVTIVDDHLDLAFIELPAGKAAPGLPLGLAASIPVDGTDVWSAGYPGLINKPSWQLGRGSISNRSLVVEELGDKASAVYIQHTAPIDPGNSGGPLLVGDAKNPADLRVIGVNTWSAVGRNSAFFSVPVTKLAEALARAAAFKALRGAEADKYTAGLRTSLAGKAQEFESFINSPEWNAFAYQGAISYALAINGGFRGLSDSLRTMSTKDRKSWLSSLVNESAFETLRKYASWRLWQDYHKTSADFRFTGLDSVLTLEKGEQIVAFSSAGLELKSSWMLENGNWRLKEFNPKPIGGGTSSATGPGAKPEATGTGTAAAKPAAADSGPTVSIGDFRSTGFYGGLGLSIPASDSADPNLSFAARIGVDWATASFFSISPFVSFHRAEASQAEVAYDAQSNSSYYGYSRYVAMKKSWWEIGIGITVKLQLPIEIGPGYILPYAQGGFGVMIPLETGTRSNTSSSDTTSFLSGMTLAAIYGFGLEFSFDKTLAFGVSWLAYNNVGIIFNSYSNIRSMPLMVYIKPLSNGY